MFQSLYLVFLVGCSSNPLINHFDLPEGAGARLDCSWNGRLNDGQVNLFEGYNGTELNHGPNVAGKAAKYRVPSGPAIINVKINWMVTIFGPIRQAHAEFSLNLKEDVRLPQFFGRFNYGHVPAHTRMGLRSPDKSVVFVDYKTPRYTQRYFA